MRGIWVVALVAAVFAVPAGAIVLDTDATFVREGLTAGFDIDTGVTGTVTSSVVLADGESAIASANDMGQTAVRVDGAFFADGADSWIGFGRARTSTTFTNGTGSAQSYTYDFSLSGIELFNSAFDSITESSYRATIFLNGSAIFFSEATLNNGALTTIGTDLGSTVVVTAFDGSTATFDPFSASLNLGSFNDGDSFVIETVISAQVNTAGFEIGGYAYIGDPGVLSANNGLGGVIVQGTAPPGNVPEPATMTLLGLGLAGLAARARRKA